MWPFGRHGKQAQVFPGVAMVGLRNGLVDYARFVAALGIVWFHASAPGARAAYLALPFFLVLLSTPSRASFADRAQRLLKPFLIWSVIYGAVQVLLALKHGRPALVWWQPEMLLTGTALHLWFLPFALLVYPLRHLSNRPWLAALMPIAASAALALWGGGGSAAPWAQWSFGILPVLLGIAWFGIGRWSFVVLILCFVILQNFRPSEDNLIIIGGSALAIAMLAFRLPTTALSTRCARLSMWIYLGHVLVIITGQTAGFEGAGLGLFATAGSVALAACIDRVQHSGWPGGRQVVARG